MVYCFFRYWREVAEESQIWTKTRIKFTKKNFDIMIQSKKLKIVPELLLDKRLIVKQVSTLFQKLPTTSVKHLIIIGSNHYGVKPKHILGGLEKIETIEIKDCSFPSHLFAYLMQNAADKIQKLQLRKNMCFYGIKPEILVKGLSKIKFVDMNWSSLACNQEFPVFNMLRSFDKKKLKSISLHADGEIASFSSRNNVLFANYSFPGQVLGSFLECVFPPEINVKLFINYPGYNVYLIKNHVFVVKKKK